MTTPLLTLRGVSKSYGQVHANTGVDLDIAPGSIHAILGENGAGKSTLMKLIYGVENPDEGVFAWKGAPLDLHSPADARRVGIGMVFQHFSLFETLTVVENVSLVVPGDKRSLSRRITELGDQFGLSVDPQAHVHALSVGERQRVEIIRCLLMNPQLLILDEPTSVLPPQSVDRLFDTLRKLAQGGVSILFISHKLEEIRAICDRATVLRRGKVVGHVDPRTQTAEALALMMTGQAIPDTLPARPMPQGAVRLKLHGLDHIQDDPFRVSLQHIDLHASEGEILGIAGVSGNGQSELAALISGETRLSTANKSDVWMLGADVAHLDPAARRKLGFAFVPEDRLAQGAVPEMSLTQNSVLTAHAQGLVRRGLIDFGKAAAFARACISGFDVRTPDERAQAGALSGGNLQKFIIGREIMLNPQLLLVNQPTWGVDVAASAAIRQRLVQLRNDGCAIVVISEELDELFEISDHIQVLNRGRLSARLKTADTRPEDIGGLMLGTPEETA